MSGNKAPLQRLLMALKNLTGDASSGTSREVAELHRELDDRREEIVRLRKEYALLQEQRRGQAGRAADEAVESMVQQFAAPLANLGAMQARHREQGALNLNDILHVVASFEKILAERGMQQIGQVGEELPYDPALHQMLDSSLPLPGQQVRIRFVGCRFKGKIIAKARAGLVNNSSIRDGSRI